MSVKRYDLEYPPFSRFGDEREMIERVDGAWVRHDDYAALEARCAKLLRAVKIALIALKPPCPVDPDGLAYETCRKAAGITYGADTNHTSGGGA